ncbi:response regulator [uncultured Methylobacterium sp.]|uniref:PAS domain-containing hybrid sensor histidine kinase/response regulator n=1 Tax=uncultured Methylobacterium sp. TaxID=157278 RepID=UPI0035CB4BA2
MLLSIRTSLTGLGTFAASRLGIAPAAPTSAETARGRMTAIVGPGAASDLTAIAETTRRDPLSASMTSERSRMPEGDDDAGGEAFHRLIAETMSDVVIVRRGDEAPIHVSPSLRRLLGLDPAEFRLRERVHPQDLTALDALDAGIGPSKPSTVLTIRIRHADGRWIWVEAVNDHLAMPGAPAIISTLRDVTDRRHHADELRMARDAAELAQARAESTTRAKSEFIGLMSHEIRTPLTAIRGFIDLLGDGEPLSPQQRRHLRLVEASTETLLVAVDDILDYARSETGDLRIEARSFALAPMITAVADLIRPAAAGKDVALDLSLGRALPELVIGDERRLRQILLNLLNDAVGIARAGKVALSIQGARLGQATGTLRFAITATVPDDRAVAYQPRTAQIDGSGLGLTVAQRLVGLMGGRIDRATRPGEATAYRFSVVLPEARPAGIVTVAEHAMTRSARVLVAEDNAIDGEVVIAMLERAGCIVDLVGNGNAALEAVQVRSYDLVLMDVLMPVMDGMTATRRIRALQHPCRCVPIVAVSADVMPHRVRAFLDAGMNAHVAKPFDRGTLADAVARQLSTVVLLDTGEEGSRPARPAVFDRACYDGLRSELGVDAAQGTLRAFIALLQSGDGDSVIREASTIAVGAERLGFLDLANAYGRLALADGPETAAAQRRCRIARDLAQRTFDELTCLERPDVSQHVALL